ncbi:flavin reductase family protein [Streptomyces sp. NPDC003832]
MNSYAAADARTGSDQPVSGELFRQVMGSVCTPVSVASAMDEGQPHGTTVSAFTSLSLQPPMVLIALDHGSSLLSVLQRTRRFGLNILGAGQDDLATTFARKGTDKFAGVAWQEDAGLPKLFGTIGWLACEVAQLVEGGDHMVVMGTVLSADHQDGAPLTYHRRLFGTHTAHPDAG